MSWVAILMGSDDDWPVMQGTWTTLNELGVQSEVRVSSAFFTAEALAGYVRDAQERECSVFVCSNTLASAVAAQTARPVIQVLPSVTAAVPLVGDAMPIGVPLALVPVGADEAANAGYLAAQMLAVADTPLFGRLQQARKDAASRVERQNKKLQANIKQASG